MSDFSSFFLLHQTSILNLGLTIFLSVQLGLLARVGFVQKYFDWWRVLSIVSIIQILFLFLEIYFYAGEIWFGFSSEERIIIFKTRPSTYVFLLYAVQTVFFRKLSEMTVSIHDRLPPGVKL